jgi:perosamine synthetase
LRLVAPMQTRPNPFGCLACENVQLNEALKSRRQFMTQPFLPFARPSITDAEREAAIEVLNSGWLTTGPRVRTFETEFAKFTGARHAVAVNSATAALHLALDALGVGPGAEVIVPTWTFAASSEVIVHCGAAPVLVDIDAATLNASVEGILGRVTSRTRAVIAVHFAGLPVDVERLRDALDERGIPLIEDAAHAFPSRLSPDGRLAGTIGRIGAYSFYATKTITTGEGGMLVTDDDAVADRARVMSLHGISRDAWKRYSESGSWYYEIEEAGFKYNMTDLAAAIGLVQLGRAEELLAARRALAAKYAVAIAGSSVADVIELPPGRNDAAHAWHLFVIRLRMDRLAIDRAAVMDGLRDRGIGASVHFIPLHLHPYYRRSWATVAEDYPVATAEYQRVVSLPLWPGMTDIDLQRVVDALEEVLSGGRSAKQA